MREPPPCLDPPFFPKSGRAKILRIAPGKGRGQGGALGPDTRRRQSRSRTGTLRARAPPSTTSCEVAGLGGGLASEGPVSSGAPSGGRSFDLHSAARV